MDLSKNNIVSRHFSKKVMGGLSEFEVRDFLHVLAEEIRHLTQLNKDQNQKLNEQEELIRDYRDREHILKQSISSAQEVADKIRRDADEQCRLILEKAQDKSDSLIQEARHSLQSVYNDIADLKRLHLQFKTSLKAALHAQLELLEQGPLFASSLPYNNTEALEDKKLSIEEKIPEGLGSEKLEEEKSGEEETSEELSSEKSEEMKQIKELEDLENSLSEELNSDEELQSLKSSLQSLDKNFS